MFRLPVGTQRMQMPLDCEATSLTIALGSVGVHTTQQYVQGHFPTDTRAPVLGADGLPAEWGDPYVDFVGHVMGSEPGSNPHWTAYAGWGAYAPVVAHAAESLGAPVAAQLSGWNPQAQSHCPKSARRLLEIVVQDRRYADPGQSGRDRGR